MATKNNRIDQDEIDCRKLLLGRVAGKMTTVYAKKIEIIQRETVNSAELCDCVPVIMDLITCDLRVDATVRQALLRSLVQMVVSSENVMRKISDEWKTDVLMKNLTRVVREHVMTQYKHYQLYAHNLVTVVKCLEKAINNSEAKENEFIKSTYLMGNNSCTILDVLLKPIQYLVNMNKIFNDFDCMLLNHEDAFYVEDIKRYLKQVFNKIQSKIDLMSESVINIVRRYEIRCEKKQSVEENLEKIKKKCIEIFKTIIVLPFTFILNLYSKHYFPNEEEMKFYLQKFDCYT